MHIFYIPKITGNTIILPEEESKHCVRVLRMVQGDLLQIVDGNGNLFTCKIVDPHPKHCSVEIIETKNEFGKRNFHLHIAIAPTKNIDRFEWFLEKATEIGIDEITPILCDHSERKVVNVERLQRVITAAMKQSIKAYMPKINPITPFGNVIISAKEKTKMIAYCGNFDEPHAKNLIVQGDSLLFLIGPEGDFSPAEVDLSISNGFKSVGLGPSRLRTETAGVVACAIANISNNL
ncbi:MAG: 16S rRNA (uracil(1498)-N(3))-methyltransferase [Bacteroidetes bacterium HGW-Bacteroidetes-15]|nr:MAG: 16S rRNA (uracil(1498)-N(3))-methyltransferase [Bacteroidetes bacterium HGW-Bacteroidetes-15]